MVSARWNLWAVLCAALAIAYPMQGGTEPTLGGIEASVRRLEVQLEQARFRAVALEAPALRSRALALPPSTATRRLLVCTEIAAATAAIALRQDGNAQVYLQRALQLDPGLTLATGAAPKLRRTLESLRGLI